MTWQKDHPLKQVTLDMLKCLILAHQAGSTSNIISSEECDPTCYKLIESAAPKRKIVSSRWIGSQESLHNRIMSLRNKADNLARNKCYEKAIRSYSGAIRLCSHWLSEEPSLRASLHHNRAAAMIACGWYDEALPDCNAAIVLESAWVKPYYLKATALQGVGRHREALRFFAFLARARPDARIELPSGSMLGAHPTSNPATVLKHKDLLQVCEAPKETLTHLPKGWIARESRLRPGEWFYENIETNSRQWIRPEISSNQDQLKVYCLEKTAMLTC